MYRQMVGPAVLAGK